MSEFIECDTCRAKPGTPTLCAECLRRRAVCELDGIVQYVTKHISVSFEH